MVKQASRRLVKILAVGLSTAFVMTSGIPAQSQVQPFPELQARVEFPPAPNRGAPPRTRGGGSRREPCGSEWSQQSLTPLMPINNVGTTVASNPTLYLYLPQVFNKPAEFIVTEEETGKVIHQRTFSLPNKAGIVKVSLPQTVELAASKTYLWEFRIICNWNDREADEAVTGWIERMAVSSDLDAKLKMVKEDSIERAKLYAAAGIWQESLHILANLRQSNPTAWSELLDSVGLGTIASMPILDCCQPKENNPSLISSTAE